MSTISNLHIDRLGEGTPGAPDPSRIIEGAPKFTSWALDNPAVTTGIWAATPGHHRVIYDQDENEAFYIIEGEIELHREGEAAPERFGPGALVVIEAGFTGSWRTITPVRKVYFFPG